MSDLAHASAACHNGTSEQERRGGGETGHCMTDGAAGGKSADDLERLLLGGDPDISLAALAEAAGLSPEVASLFWHALGFPDTEPAGRMFTRGDKDAIVTLARLIT